MRARPPSSSIIGHLFTASYICMQSASSPCYQLLIPNSFCPALFQTLQEYLDIFSLPFFPTKRPRLSSSLFIFTIDNVLRYGDAMKLQLRFISCLRQRFRPSCFVVKSLSHRLSSVIATPPRCLRYRGCSHWCYELTSHRVARHVGHCLLALTGKP